MESTTIQSETRQRKPIPVIRSNRHDINRMMGIFAAINEFELCEKEMENRIRAIPNGWRDMRLIDRKLTDIINGLVQTFPQEKMISLRRMIPGMAYKPITPSPQPWKRMKPSWSRVRSMCFATTRTNNARCV